MAERVIAALNDRWRVVDDPLQWILQVRRGRKTGKTTGWKGRRFCQQRRTLIRDIGELCGEVAPAAMALVKALPDRHQSLRHDHLVRGRAKTRKAWRKADNLTPGRA